MKLNGTALRVCRRSNLLAKMGFYLLVDSGVFKSSEVQQCRNGECVQQSQKFRIFEIFQVCSHIVGNLFEHCFVLKQNRK